MVAKVHLHQKHKDFHYYIANNKILNIHKFCNIGYQMNIWNVRKPK